MAPALASTRRVPAEALREGGRGGSEGWRTRRWGDALVIGEVALALLLTVGAGLLVRSFWELEHVSPGFDPTGVLTASVELPDIPYGTGDKAATFFEDLLRRVRALPGASDAAIVSALPLFESGWTSDFIAAGRAPGEYGTEVAHRMISPDYFRAMRVPLLAGRTLTVEDRKDAPRVLVINDALARTYFRGQHPIGQRIAFDKVPDSTTTWWTIVGVVGNEHQKSLAAAPRIEVYHPFAQSGGSAMTLVVRTGRDPLALAPTIRRVVAALDPKLAIASMRTMDAVHADSLARDRFLMTLLIIFAAVGLALAVVGVYGVLAHLARRRTREIGIRLALGARGSEVRWLVAGHGLRLILAGLGVGAAVALPGARLLRGLLYMVPPTDPLTFASVAALLALTGMVASWLPAMKASRADPAIALRE
jgi:putative ABC transport system permease protein